MRVETGEMKMTSEQKVLVKSSWRALSSFSDQAAEVFYGKLFELDGSLVSVFKNDLGEQKRKWMHSLGFVVANLNSPTTLMPVIKHFARRHAFYGAQPTLLSSVSAAFLFMLRQGLKEKFTLEVEAAWAAFLDELAGMLLPDAGDGMPSTRVAA